MGSGHSNISKKEVTPNQKRKDDKTKKTTGDSAALNVSQRKDVMISYSHQDIDLMRKLRGKFLKYNLKN